MCPIANAEVRRRDVTRRCVSELYFSHIAQEEAFTPIATLETRALDVTRNAHVCSRRLARFAVFRGSTR